MPRNFDKIACAIPGCKGWAIHGSAPPRCSPHSGHAGAPPANSNRLVHGYYTGVLRPDEVSGLSGTVAATNLDAEILITRAAIRRLFQMLRDGATPGPDPRPLRAEDYARFIGLVFQGAGAVSRLLRARAALSGDSGPLEQLMDEVLDQISAEWGVQL